MRARERQSLLSSCLAKGSSSSCRDVDILARSHGPGFRGPPDGGLSETFGRSNGVHCRVRSVSCSPVAA
jgi:hypothetical protein